MSNLLWAQVRTLGKSLDNSSTENVFAKVLEEVSKLHQFELPACSGSLPARAGTLTLVSTFLCSSVTPCLIRRALVRLLWGVLRSREVIPNALPLGLLLGVTLSLIAYVYRDSEKLLDRTVLPF